jgi:hypothetical protein
MGSKASQGENMVQPEEQEINIQENNLILHLDNNRGIDVYYFGNLVCFDMFT